MLSAPILASLLSLPSMIALFKETSLAWIGDIPLQDIYPEAKN
jgi:hypothetical protein